ncbi:UTRA domain-containing protein [Micromonospora sp. CPCC 205539]|uniref:UTRA domain-containing protein n=1 Tax=Micromonospora sp. CPCC 205539 TaxID=3122408 RepID=UPI002FF43AA3
MGQPRWTTTSDQYLDPTAGDTWAAEAAASGQQGSQRILDATTLPAPVDVAVLLALPKDAPVVLRRRLLLADDHAVEVATSYWPADLADLTRLAQPEKIPGGTARFLAEIGHTPAEIREEVSAASAQSRPLDQRALKLKATDPILVLARVLLGAGGMPYQVDVNVMRAGQRIRYTRQAG